MAGKRYTGQSHGQTRSYMNGITDRHTRLMLAKASTPKKPKGSVNSSTLAARKAVLEEKGLLLALEQGLSCTVNLPGNREGVATGLTAEGFVIVKGWSEPFNPAAIGFRRPPGT